MRMLNDVKQGQDELSDRPIKVLYLKSPNAAQDER
jgi:hypothetical protein